MSETNMLYCPEEGCTFSYTHGETNTLKTHRTKVHITSMKVTYQNPIRDVVISRIEKSFQCDRCVFSTSYPSVIQKHARQCTGAVPSHIKLSRTNTPEILPLSLTQRSLVERSPAPLVPILLSQSASPVDLPTLRLSDYTPRPNNTTVIDHPPYNLPSFGITVDTHFRVIVCLNCERAIDPNNLVAHIRKDLPLLDIPDDLSSVLEMTYGLIPYSSVKYMAAAITPIFGIPLHPSPLFFCDCGRGFGTQESLRTHQTRNEDRLCPMKLQNPGFHRGYGQRLTSNHTFFEVNPSCWLNDLEEQSYPLAFSKSVPPLRDYSTMLIKSAEDEMNISSFFYTQRWIKHLDEYTPADIVEVLLESTPEAPYGERLRFVAEEFLRVANAVIKNYNSFGVLKLIGQTTERETIHRFDPVSEKTVKKYALTLHRLIFGVIRQIDPVYAHKYRYPPLHETQIIHLRRLKSALEREASMPDLLDYFQAACFCLFAHHQHQYENTQDLDQFFSPVICFLVLSSVREKGGFKLPSVITQYIAHIMFSIRSTIFNEIKKKSQQEKISVSYAYISFKEFLTSGHETPMAYYYNVLTLLACIRSDETNEARFTCTDERGREFSYEGSLIKVNAITTMINDIYHRYTTLVRKFCFFGEPIPHTLSLQVNLEEIVDNLQNTQPGYSFMDDPRNPFLSYRSAYGEWLLSDRERATKYTYIQGDRLLWKPRPSLEFLQNLKELRHLLLLLCIFSAGPSSRASEVARQLFRNLPGSYRNLLCLFHVVCLVDIQDKTSHKHLRDKYVPHCPTRFITKILIYNLAIFRPFEEYLVNILLGDEAGLRYHEQLWPGLKETITDTNISDAIGRECTRYLIPSYSIVKVPYKILFWRNLVSAILKHQPDVKTIATHQQYYIDTAMMHSTNMAVARYGGDTGNLPMSDPRQVVECIKVGLEWHKIINFDKKKGGSDELDAQLEKIEANATGSTSSDTMQLSSGSIVTVSNKIIDVVGSHLEDMVQETVMKAIAEMSYTYFPKIKPVIDVDQLDISNIVVPPLRLQQLRSFIKNNTAQFTCPEQAALLELMIQRTQSVLAILGTGMGKTFIILLQAALQKGLVTIVVLPLSTLHNDLKRRSGKLGVPYSRWAPNGKFNENVHVLSVSIEHLGFPDFIKFLSDLEHQRKLGPIVFDEIHKVLTDSDYRDAFKNYQIVNSVKGVVFGLTGSLPPSLYPVLCEITATNWKMIRTPSSRKELKYEVIAIKSESDMDIAIVNHLNKAISTYRPEDRAIVFCQSKKHVTALADLFKTHPYYSPGDNELILQKNKEAMVRWIAGDCRVMTSTSILGCGIDYLNIRDVIHRDPSFTMLDQYQEDSRGGRDGLECRATTFVVEKKRYQNPNQGYDFGTKVLYDMMNDTKQCRQIPLTKYLDGKAVQCVTLPGAVFCDNCEQSLTLTLDHIDTIPRSLP